MEGVYLGGGEMKNLTRQILFDFVRDHFTKDIKYLGLPGELLYFEEKLAAIGDIIDIEMDGYDWKAKVVSIASAKADISRIPISLHQGDIHSASGKYNFAWFDYCGCLSADKIYGIQKFLVDNIYYNETDSPVLAVTLMKGREKVQLWDKVSELPLDKKRDWKWLRRKFFPSFINETLSLSGKYFHVDHYMEYKETTPMFLIVGRILNGVRPVNDFFIEKLDRVVPLI